MIFNMVDIQDIKKLNPHAVNDAGDFVPFSQQVLFYSSSNRSPIDALVLLPDSKLLGNVTGSKGVPVTINKSVIDKILNKHSVSIEELFALDELIENNAALVMESMTREDSVVVIMDSQKFGRSHLMASVLVNIESKQNLVTVNKLTSAYERENLPGLIQRTWDAGKAIYITPNTETWIIATGLQLPQELSRLVENYSTKGDKSQIRAVRNLTSKSENHIRSDKPPRDPPGQFQSRNQTRSNHNREAR